MRPSLALLAYACGLVVLFGAASGVGSLVGPVVGPATPGGQDHTSDHANGQMDGQTEDPDGHTDGHTDGSEDGADDEVAPAGLTLALVGAAPGPGRTALTFEVRRPDGAPVTDFTPNHGKAVHLIAVRHDMTGYQHVHPEPVGDGSWTVPVDLGPGTWRLIADVVPTEDDEPVAVTTDLTVAGDWTPAPLPAPATTAEVDGYTVGLDGSLVAGTSRTLTFTVAKDGRPVTDLQPYLEAYGHLVALRTSDLAYLHVHPGDHAGDGHGAGGPGAAGPDIAFGAVAPSADSYRLFVDFRHEDAVRTAELTAVAAPADGDAPTDGDAVLDPSTEPAHDAATHEH